MDRIAVLLMAYGTPDKASDVKGYLEDIFGGKSPDERIVQNVQNKYEKINFSPLTKITYQQAEMIKSGIELNGVCADVLIGMKHWTPKIEESADKISLMGVSKVVGLIAHPFKSVAGSDEYKERFMASFKGVRAIFIDSWYDQPKLIEAWAEEIKNAVGDGADLNKFYFIFTSHGLPASINDPEYSSELREFVARLSHRLRIDEYTLAFQNGGHSNWTKPEASEKMKELALSGKKNLVVVPIGYISESLETLYDIDVEYANLAASLGVRMLRVRSLDTSQKLIDSMVSAIMSAIE